MVKVSSGSTSRSNAVSTLNRTTVIPAGRMTVEPGKSLPPKSSGETVSKAPRRKLASMPRGAVLVLAAVTVNTTYSPSAAAASFTVKSRSSFSTVTTALPGGSMM